MNNPNSQTPIDRLIQADKLLKQLVKDAKQNTNLAVSLAMLLERTHMKIQNNLPTETTYTPRPIFS